MNLLKRLGLIVGAAGVTFAIIVISIIVYQYTAMAPELPNNSDCQLVAMQQTNDHAAEVRHYQCQRGEQQQWAGHELWLYQPQTDDWQRMLTTQSASCLRLSLERQRLSVGHDGERMEMNLAEPVFLYKSQTGASESLAVSIDKTPLAKGC